MEDITYMMVMSVCSPYTFWCLRIDNGNHPVTSTSARELCVSWSHTLGHPSFIWPLKMLCWSPWGVQRFGGWGVEGWAQSPCCILPAQPCCKPYSLPSSDVWVCWPHCVLDTLLKQPSDPWGSFQGATQFLHSASLLLIQKRKFVCLYMYI